MPAKKTPAATPAVRPTHQSQLCLTCGQNPILPEHTSFGCEHGAWDLTGYADEQPADDTAGAMLEAEPGAGD